MMKKNLFSPVLYTFLVIAFLVSCKPDDSKDSKLSELDQHINDFIWTGLHDYYLWVDNVPELALSNFPTEASYDDFINANADHEDFFYSLLYKYGKVDRFSWIVDDYEELENMFQGITKSMGYEFLLGRITGTNKLFMIVIYVLPNSPAQIAGIRRGNVFLKVNGQDITEANYSQLLFENESYTLTYGVITSNGLATSTNTVSVTALEIQENPIYIDSVYTVGTHKIGYLMYNGFMSNYDNQLNAVFKNFKSQHINDLILDVRYNPGGAVTTASYLASMIYTNDTNKVFIRERYNTGLQAYIDETYGTDYSIVNFADKIEASEESTEEAINSLNLSRLFMITSYNTASASELVLFGLKPYLNVTTIGTTTYGKYVGSFTVKDYDKNDKLNTEHKWAMQPITLKAENSLGESDYVYGFAPSDSLSEDPANLGILGNTNEPLLKRAIGHITGDIKSAETLPVSNFSLTRFGFSKDRNRFSKEMYVKNCFQSK
jgi:carboxyl-terminal processing protease